MLPDSYAVILAARAMEATKKAYAPYSNFPVGAAVAHTSKIAIGCNVENQSFGLTMCAERVAIYSAITTGWLNKTTKITALAVYAVNQDYVKPCGACLQVISEFADENTVILLMDRSNGPIKQLKFADLLPQAFSLE
ncbi:MAG: cytidine deaminase [Parcubacteria group bacterium CG1_02_40_25]|nr:MAG: cytidine deaminase [Parcubacteria group bacterium CG1_02_40_25]